MQPLSRGRVLVLEDAASGATAAQAVARSGFEMRTVTKARDALDLAGREAFDVVVVDLDLSDVDGVALVRRLHEEGLSPAVVWLTSSTSNDLSATAAEVGVVQVLHKSADSKALARVIALGVTQNRDLFSTLRAIVRPAAMARSVPATNAKNGFGAMLDAAVQDGAIIITKHDAPKAVLLSFERLRDLLAKREPNLQALTQEFDDMVARMGTASARAAARRLFTSAPSAFADAAVAGAKKHG